MNFTKTLTGNNIHLLKDFADNTFDSVVTDAPYGLGKEPDAMKLLQDWIDHGYHEIKGKGFMGKEWDAFVPQPVFWKEVFRVLKPGGYVLCFFGTRTYDYGTLAIRLAGFEIRDCIQWIYGSGFPKSLNVSKAIDAKFGAEREVIGTYGTMPIQTSGRINSEESAVNGSFERTENNLTEPSTPEAKQWDGYGTALKPACELICMARKPFTGTVADNVLTHGTEGININACRIETSENISNHSRGLESSISKGKYGDSSEQETHQTQGQKLGRFPSNVILDEVAAEVMDEQTGVLKSGAMTKAYEYTNNGFSIGNPTGSTKQIHQSNEGGASRFFYCAKASTSERNAGLEDMEFKRYSDRDKEDGLGGENPRNRSNTEKQNFHPTVKPISLMRYLIRLVTPKGGLTLDPFAGSGTTGCAAEFEETNIILMEMTEEYIPIINARVAHWRIEAQKERAELAKEALIQQQLKNQLSFF
jgi:site-specific DNA-methyltransferase (adenine-specific)